MFNPFSGEDSPGRRFRLPVSDAPGGGFWLPETMCRCFSVRLLRKFGSFSALLKEARKRSPRLSNVDVVELFVRERILHDFPFWAASFVKIKRKGGGDDAPFILNNPQRKLVSMFEEMRVAGHPIRVILLKARQWGGSTCTQIYMAWLQLVHQTGLNSLVIAHQLSCSHEILDMFDRMIKQYPEMLLAPHNPPMGEGAQSSRGEGRGPSLKSAGRSGSAFRVSLRNCKIKVGTAERPDSCRGGDYNLVHLSEVGIWKETKGKRPEDIVRSACSGILLKPMTMIVMESTANGVGNFFHHEYQAAKEGKSQFRPLFIPWFDIEAYTKKLDDPDDFERWLLDHREEETSDSRSVPGSYLWYLRQQGASLEAINWYVEERKKFSDQAGMASEYPSNDEEAFAHSGENVIAREHIVRLRDGVETPLNIGEIDDFGEFVAENTGHLKIWRFPSETCDWRDRYLVVVDVGGRSLKSDWSVIAVFDRLGEKEKPEIVAQWRGHTDHDLLADNAARIGRFYHDALLVIESNTLETRDSERDVDGDQAPYLLRRLNDEYPNLYHRTGSGRPKPGFHTNLSTKGMVIGELVRMLRTGGYIERDADCLDELAQYLKRPNGSYGAAVGCHDDILMTRAIGLYISNIEMDPPSRKRFLTSSPRRSGPLSEAHF